MYCPHFHARRCRSCTTLTTPYAEQLRAKQARCEQQLAACTELQWLPAVASDEGGFRNKAKMVVSGKVEAPLLGILGADGRGVDLRDCGLYPPSLQSSFGPMADLIRRARIAPYNVEQRRGELKYLLVTESPDRELMLRLVLRSTAAVDAIRRELPELLRQLPRLAVVSVNLQPEHKAVLEGDEEIVLTERSELALRLNDLTLYLRPQSFFQTNTEIAEALYAQAREWVDERAPRSVWDLYCGVGGFALHAASAWRDVTGIELSREAIASADRSRDEAGLRRLQFVAAEATAYVRQASAWPELAIVNPPRRGLGAELAALLDASTIDTLIYSSCNAESLARDLQAMPGFVARQARVLDMFPQTEHYEVILRLERRAA